MSTKPKDLIGHGVHLGHKKNKSHPKAYKYIHKNEKGIAIIDLFQTSEKLEEAIKYTTKIAKEGKTLLVVATKKVAREPVTELCKEHNVPYMTKKWVGGFLTNFEEIFKNIKRMNDMREKQTAGEWKELINHERVQLEKRLNRIASVYAGVDTLTKVPDALFIVDIRKEKNALSETNQVNVPAIAIVDTNVSPENVDYPIPGNDDAISSITHISKLVIEAYAKNYKKKE